MLDGTGTQLLITGTSQLERVNKAWAKSFLLDMVESIGMTTIFGPQIDILTTERMTGFVILAESHSSIHWTRPALYLDLFSCKAFEVDDVVLWVTNEWKMVKGYYQVIERGWNPDLNREVKAQELPLLPMAYSKSSV